MRWLVILCTDHRGGKAWWQGDEVAGPIASSQEWRGTKTGWCSARFPYFFKVWDSSLFRVGLPALLNLSGNSLWTYPQVFPG